MKELEYLELQEVGIEEIISYSKLNTSPVITILDDLNYGLFNEVVAYADTLKLVFFIIKGTHKVAFVGNQKLALKIAKILEVKAQTMYRSILKPRKLLGQVCMPTRGSNYIVKSFDVKGKETEPFVDTNVKMVSCDTLLKYHFSPYKYAMRIRGAGNNKIESLESLKILRDNFLKTGTIS